MVIKEIISKCMLKNYSVENYFKEYGLKATKIDPDSFYKGCMELNVEISDFKQTALSKILQSNDKKNYLDIKKIMIEEEVI